MTLKATQSRDSGGGFQEQMPHNFKNSYEAAMYLAEELAFGGEIVDLDKCHIQVKTLAIDVVDITKFEGTAKEMKPLIDLIAYYFKGIEENGELVDKTVAAKAESATEWTTGTMPTLFALGIFSTLQGKIRIKIAMMLICGIKSKKEIEVGIDGSHSIEDFAAALLLMKESGCSLKELLYEG